jgi:hypothetical protein
MLPWPMDLDPTAHNLPKHPPVDPYERSRSNQRIGTPLLIHVVPFRSNGARVVFSPQQSNQKAAPPRDTAVHRRTTQSMAERALFSNPRHATRKGRECESRDGKSHRAPKRRPGCPRCTAETKVRRRIPDTTAVVPSPDGHENLTRHPASARLSGEVDSGAGGQFLPPPHSLSEPVRCLAGDTMTWKGEAHGEVTR